jgi:hypothetical protein
MIEIKRAFQGKKDWFNADGQAGRDTEGLEKKVITRIFFLRNEPQVTQKKAVVKIPFKARRLLHA